MFRLLILSACLFSLILPSHSYAIVGRLEQQIQFIHCTSDLKRCWKKILNLPEARRLVSLIQKEGSFSIVSANNHPLTKKFGAFWDPGPRIITINASIDRTEGDLIASIIFELHNASSNSLLTRLDHQAAAGFIDCKAYVEGVELIEYQNSLNASKMTRKGIECGILPKSSLLRVYETFEEHYSAQKACGHSTLIARNYKKLASSQIARKCKTYPNGTNNSLIFRPRQSPGVRKS